MSKKEVLGKLLDHKKVAVLRVLLSSSEEMYLKEIAQRSSVSITSTFRILQELTALELVEKRKWKTSKVYGCTQKESTAFLRVLLAEEYDGLKEFVQELETVQGIQQVLLQGTRRKGKANVLIIGQDVEGRRVEEACKRIREKGFELSYLTLTKEQYEQMVTMGLYSGEKVMLKG